MSDGTKADDIALALEEAIVSGEIPPGSTLRQEHLSEQFQVSRTPVREALRRLAALGLVTFEPNRGVRVRTLSLDEIREAFMVRAELESLATEIATPKMTEDDLAELERAERRFHRATERLVEMSHEGRQDLEIARDWLHLNHAFHDVIYSAADVPLIERMAKAARRTFLVKPVWATGADLDELYVKNDRQHRAIRDAIAARSPEGARVLAREHVLSSGRLLEAILDKVSAQSREPSSAARRSRSRMPLQNRVTPLGELIAHPARGLVYGNRGCLHDDSGRIRRRYAVRRWIACRLEFRGWHRGPLLQPGKFTELFFLDEATAFAAGHRPCALCRREDYVRFSRSGREIHGEPVGADAIDGRLQTERIDPANAGSPAAPRLVRRAPGRRLRPRIRRTPGSYWGLKC